ncbi:hypothetical protein K1T71_013356 [Dendrolimus kikuchii]|uniref:Uncharacterized protein n=1 Tax=Dendrolimus kikuchii TaxID=765133 RepID=A0ACC1CI83_9NEOP|nr:hypothetical protein K1T71_013356 [Dendrolimus kikuchii]
MRFIILLIQITAAHSTLNVTDTTNKIKTILAKYKYNRFRRLQNLRNYGVFLQKSLNFFEKTERYGEYLKYRNISDCNRSRDTTDMKNHVLNGLLIHDDLPETHWNEYKSVHKKVYPTTHHETLAQKKWQENLRKVSKHNRDYLAGVHSYSLHLNHLGDMDVNQYIRKALKLINTIPLFDPAEDKRKTAYHKSLKCSIPTRIDWRAKGYNPKLEEQWRCGACYAFAVTHALQAQLYKRHGDWRELSPQEIVDCSIKDGNMGCEGGSLIGALRYAARDGLIMENHYPYIGKKGFCKYRKDLVKVKPRRWATLNPGDEAAMERILATVGPIAVGVNASPYTFQLYRSGIYDDPFCTPWELNHAMLLVGYTPQYWILLNWWGKNWGEHGYMRIRRGLNRCGISNIPTYVEL